MKTPTFDWEALAPIVALGGGMVVALVLGLLPGRGGRFLAVLSGVIATGIAIGAAVLLWNHGVQREAIARSVVIDRASLAAIVIASGSALTGILLAARAHGTEDAGHGETTALILASAFGMAILASANDLVTIFLGLEMLSIPLYVLCASHVDRTASLESGLKYLILGSVGSATALMGLALLYGATGSMYLPDIARTAGDSDLQGLIYPGVALLIAGFGFKLSLAPLHQWTPDVYDGAPTAVTAFMSVATKTAALVVTARLLLVGLGAEDVRDLWEPILLTLAAASIIIGNVGALGQPGMKRLMGYSSIAQAGYLVAALAVGAVGALLAYLAAYAVSTLTVFAVVSARESERPELGDDISALDGLAKERPLLAWLGTLGLFGLAGLPLTAGFFGKVAVAGALVNADKAWLAVLILIGSIISLAYYAPPVIRMWRTVGPDAEEASDEPISVTSTPSGAPNLAGGATGSAGVVAPVPTGLRWEVALIGTVAAALVLAGGLYPDPLLNLATEASAALFGVQ
ncbi:MAG: NADH-quinone oxidoreductase subunit N [Solirubrobacteraceae bacterium]|nr:NADH-quinone oxidoreductase subunit N [Solirubrobacteraceae bacterium]